MTSSQLRDLSGYLELLAFRRREQGDMRHIRTIMDDVLSEVGAPDVTETLARLLKLARAG